MLIMKAHSVSVDGHTTTCGLYKDKIRSFILYLFQLKRNELSDHEI